MQPTGIEFSRIRVMPAIWLIGATAAWQLICLAAMREAWSAEGGGYDAGLEWQLLAGAPAVAWLFAIWNRREAYASWVVWLMVGAAVVVRLPLLGVAPAQSDDVYRYVWEGRVQWAGVNPYETAPDDPSLAGLRDAVWEEINHRELAAIYPPLAQMVLALAAGVGRVLGAPIFWMKLCFMLWDLLALGWLLLWLRVRGLNPLAAGFWAFNPLVIVEFSGNGHLDAMMIALLVGSLWLMARAEAAEGAGKRWGGQVGAVVLLSGAVLAKLVPVLLAPFYVWGLGRRFWLLALAPAIVALGYLPYLGAEAPALFGSTETYVMNWTGNAPAFELLRLVCGEDGYVARRVYWGGMAGLIVVLWALRMRPGAAAPWVFGYFLAAGPIVHPWYLTLMLPLIVMAAMERGPRQIPATLVLLPWLWLTLTIPVDYLKYEGELMEWLPWAMWGPFWILLLVNGAGAIYKRFISRGETETENDLS